MPMLRAAALVRTLQNGRQGTHKNIPKLSMPKQEVGERKDNEASTRPAFHSECGLATELSVLITIKDQMSKTDDAVFYKDDEDRFSQRYTLKLKTFAKYDVTMEVTPSLTISYLDIGGMKYDANMTNMKIEDGKTLCSFVWSTNHIKTTQRKYRSILPCLIKFKGYKEIDFEVLVKFYDNEEILHYTGVPLSSLGLHGTLSNDKEQEGQMFDIVFNQ